MKKTLLSIGFSIAMLISYNTSVAQCTPDPLYQDSIYGIWPDTTQNLPCALINQPYTTVVDFKVPTDAGAIDPNFAGVPVNYIKLDGINGLNATGLNMTYAAGPGGASQWNAGQQGCAAITGTPTVLGVYDLTMDVTANVTLGIPIDQSQTITGYRILVSNTCTVGLTNIVSTGFSLLQNTPNPFSNRTNISFTSENGNNVTFTVMNLLGKVVASDVINTSKGTNNYEFHSNNLPSGIYTYSLTQGGKTLTKRMVISK